ncbi:hypothetical protein ACFFSY_09585 [Paenibacillus aurantiacus]|uniref:Yip1 domain-containing protein n=1 Tax=Paenibacillus aurantiacus TaxID=1936118 RepID=A0ABV5KLP9_9BACL
MVSNQDKWQETAEASYDRPMGVTLLAILLLVSGGAMAITQVMNFNALNEASDVLGVSSTFLQISVAFIGGLGIAAAAGMWFGLRWGWWLALFYFAYAICRNVNVMITIFSLADELGSTMTYYIKYGIRVAWNAFLIAYLCRETASWYFKTNDTKKWKPLAAAFGAAIALFVVGSLTQ